MWFPKDSDQNCYKTARSPLREHVKKLRKIYGQSGLESQARTTDRVIKAQNRRVQRLPVKPCNSRLRRVGYRPSRQFPPPAINGVPTNPCPTWAMCTRI